MDAPLATVLIPTFNHGSTIRYALETALWQSVPVEVFVIGDGVPAASRASLRTLTQADGRIRFFDHPKHRRRGEPYRHAALQEARGRIVCYLCDRDLWLPDHVERMLGLLERADFAHSLSLHIRPDGDTLFFPCDLASPVDRERMLREENRVAFSCAAHTLEMYRRLPQGWDTTPAGKWTDWHMFQKFLAHPACRCASGTYPSALTFPSPPRIDWNEAQRLAELAAWRARIDTAAQRQSLALGLLESAVRFRDARIAEEFTMRRASEEAAAQAQQEAVLARQDTAQAREEAMSARQEALRAEAQLVQTDRALAELRDSPWWRLGRALRRFPLARRAYDLIKRRAAAQGPDAGTPTGA